jgi:hydroxymethylbilane synthase
VIERLRQFWPKLEIAIEQIHTTGDRLPDRPLAQIGGDGVFVVEIERALDERRIDLAVHSLKDLPTTQPADRRIIIPGPREDVRDVFVTNVAFQPPNSSLNPLVSGSLSISANLISEPFRIGTCSLRRTAQILRLSPSAHILPLRGNVDTRLRKLAANQYDGIVLAAAGLHRLGLQDDLPGRVTYLPIDMMMPAPGQGALAVEIRDEPEMFALLAPLNDEAVQATTTAERMFLQALGAGCYLPVGAYGEINQGILTLSGLVISLDGQQQVRVEQQMRWTRQTSIEQAEQLGIMMAEQALALGADRIIESINAKAKRGQESQHV